MVKPTSTSKLSLTNSSGATVFIMLQSTHWGNAILNVTTSTLWDDYQAQSTNIDNITRGLNFGYVATGKTVEWQRSAVITPDTGSYKFASGHVNSETVIVWTIKERNVTTTNADGTTTTTTVKELSDSKSYVVKPGETTTIPKPS